MEIRDLVSRRSAARLSSTLAAGLLASSAHAALVINELDYDQPGTDVAEFIELYNNGPSAVTLDGYTLSLINGSSGTAYLSFDLGGYSIGPDAYFLLCNNGTIGVACNYDVASTATGWIQNGGSYGDAVALYQDSALIDSVAYEAVTSVLMTFAEGGAHAGEDSGTTVMSLSRIANGFDSNRNGIDFAQGCITPGSANIAGSGDCTPVSAVPVPAAAWLFGSGLLGMLQIARRRGNKSDAG